MVFFYKSYSKPRHHLWYSGSLILLLMILTAFLGYVLPWGQMSLWGATVITSLISTVPFAGSEIVIWVWGGFAVENATLNRFFSLHYLLPFIITALVLIHLVLLHENGSTNPTGADSPSVDKINFYPYFYYKDFVGFSFLTALFCYFVFFNPNALGHPDNYIEANPMVTPEHIVPEWYFLSFYAILRSVPDKLAGVLLMLMAIICIALAPNLNYSEIKSSSIFPIQKLAVILLFTMYALLGWIGQCEALTPFIEVGQLSGLVYFSYFCLFLPFFAFFENKLFKKPDFILFSNIKYLYKYYKILHFSNLKTIIYVKT